MNETTDSDCCKSKNKMTHSKSMEGESTKEESTEEESLFEIVPGENAWDVIPEEIACEIISQLNNFQDILVYMRSSKRFTEIARRCLSLLDSPVPIQVDVRLLVGFSALQMISDNILLVVNPETINLVSTLPNLRKADILLDGPYESLIGSFYKQIFQLLPNLNLRRLTNFRITDNHGALYIQGNRFMIFPNNMLIIQDIQRTYPQLIHFNMSSIYGHRQPPGVPSLRLTSRSLRSFLREGDFGLVDPTQPPSETNPPLSIYSQRLADSGLIDVDDLYLITNIYLLYNQLIRGDIVIPDALMTRYFRGAFEVMNEERATQRLAPLQWDALNLYRNLTGVRARMLYRHNNKTFFEFDIPFPLSGQEYTNISLILVRINNVYKTHGIFYRTDGSTFTQ